MTKISVSISKQIYPKLHQNRKRKGTRKLKTQTQGPNRFIHLTPKWHSQQNCLAAKVDEIDQRRSRFENRCNNDQNANNLNENAQIANQPNNNEQNNAEHNHEQNQEPAENRPRRVPNENQELRNLIQLLTGVQKYDLPSLKDAESREVESFIRAANFYYDNSANELEDERLLTKIKEKAIICTWIPEKEIQDTQHWPQIRELLELRVKRENGPDRLRAKVREHHQSENESMINYVKRTENLFMKHIMERAW